MNRFFCLELKKKKESHVFTQLFLINFIDCITHLDNLAEEDECIYYLCIYLFSTVGCCPFCITEALWTCLSSTTDSYSRGLGPFDCEQPKSITLLITAWGHSLHNYQGKVVKTQAIPGSCWKAGTAKRASWRSIMMLQCNSSFSSAGPLQTQIRPKPEEMLYWEKTSQSPCWYCCSWEHSMLLQGQQKKQKCHRMYKQ